jgi:hypothetical protein
VAETFAGVVLAVLALCLSVLLAAARSIDDQARRR